MQDETDQLKLRIELLERENQQLKEMLGPMVGRFEFNPCFNPQRFLRVVGRTIGLAMVPVFLISMIGAFGMKFARVLAPIHLLGIPLFDFGGINSWHPGIGIGIIAFGGLAVGIIASGGGAIGLIAWGGGALGVLAIGGGSVGVIALGGGSCGIIAIGGGACGLYAMGQKARGRYVLSLARQDQEAIDLFVKWIPGLRKAVTTAMPVIPIQKSAG